MTTPGLAARAGERARSFRLHRPALTVREGPLVAAAVVALILARSAVYLLWPQASFESDQAVMGLMAKHLIEGRAFPLFLYGQNYILAVQAWLAAPVFLIFGPSPAALKLPLLLINLAIGLLLVRLLHREVGLRPALALVAALFFIVAAPRTASTILDANGGNVEPFLYVLLLWLTRRRPVWFGLIAGIGFLQREFTIYGVAAVALIELAHGTLVTREGRRGAFAAARTAAEVWLVVQWLKQFDSAAGPGTTPASLTRASNNLLEAFGRLCVDPRRMLTGAGRLFTLHWPWLFGVSSRDVAPLGLGGWAIAGVPWFGVVVGAALALAAARTGVYLWRERRWRPEYDFCAYLVLVGGCSAGVYGLGRCGVIALGTLRYDLLSVIGAIGIGAWFLAVERRAWIRRAWIAVVLAWAVVAASEHGQLWSTYLSHPRPGDKMLIARYLEAKGIKYASSDYWIAYEVTFLTNERIIVASRDVVRIAAYQREVAAHRAESVFVSRRPCGGGQQMFKGVWFCPP